MKKAKLLEYIGTLAKLKRNFNQDMADDSTRDEDKRYYRGRAEAFNEVVQEISTMESELVDQILQAPREKDEWTKRDLSTATH